MMTRPATYRCTSSRERRGIARPLVWSMGLLALGVGIACGPATPSNTPTAVGAGSGSAATEAASRHRSAASAAGSLRVPDRCPGARRLAHVDPAALARPGLHAELSPALQSRSVDVRLFLLSGSESLRTLQLQRGSAGAVRDLRARDASGPLSLEVKSTGDNSADGGVVLRLAREPAGLLEIEYRIAAAADVEASKPLTVAVDQARMRLPGERVLALPPSFDDKLVDTRVCLADTGLRGRGAASSFGVGHARRVRALGRELREASFVVGGLGHAIFDAPEGHDEAAWLGYFSFDPRQAAADVAAFRSAVGSVLGAKDPAPFTVLFIGDQRPPGDFELTPRSASLLVHVGVGQHLSGNLRMALATALVQRWLGRMLWVGPDGPSERAQAYWFSEGVARFVARELLFRFGLVSAEEYASELDRLLEVLHVSPLRDRSNRELAESLDRGALPVLVARGALYATNVDHQLRRAGGRPAALLTLLRTLLARAVAERRALSTAEWLAAVGETVGPDAAKSSFERWVRQGTERALPSQALQPCFRATRRRYEQFSLGFDLTATRRAPNQQLAGLEPAGPAYRAGLRASDELVTIQHRSGRADVEAKVRIKRDDAEQTVRYPPIGGVRRGQGFAHDERIPVERCAR